MSFELLCATMIGLLFGAIICFGGYRFFLILLPFWGFFFGFGLGAQTVQALLGDAFFATVTSWVVGFVLAVAFAVLSYLFYIVAVALIAGSLGYGLVVAIMGAIGFNFGLITWVLGIVVGVIFAWVTIRYNLAKYVIILATALGGQGWPSAPWFWASTVYRRQRPRQIQSARCCRGRRCWRSSLSSWQQRAPTCSGFRAASTRW